MLCSLCDLKAGRLYHTIGDAHIYTNHVDQIKKQLATPINTASKPVLQFKRNGMHSSILDFTVDDVSIKGYMPGEHIAAPVAV